MTDGVGWAVLVSTRAVAFDLHSTSRGIGISNVVRRALANGAAVRGFTDSGRMANICVTGLDGRTFDVGNRVGSESNWTLATGFVIFSNAHGVRAASVFTASVVAFVLKSITQLRWWAVIVINAGDLLTTLREVIRVAGIRTWRTLTLRNMIVSNADGMWTTFDTITGLDTFENALQLDAHFRLGTLSVCGTFVFHLDAAAVTIVGVSSVSGLALAASFVIFGNTRGIWWAVEL